MMTRSEETMVVPIPEWLPVPVAIKVWQIQQDGLTTEGLTILTRLATDLRMRKVWKLLDSRKRPTRHEFYHPAKFVAGSQADAQNKAMADTLCMAFTAALDRRTVSKLAEVEPTRSRFLQEAETLRRVAEEVDQSVRQAPVYISPTILSQFTADAQVLRRIADWKDCVISEIRGAADPLSITNASSDPTERGVQITIAAFLHDVFGDHLHRTAATLTAVALGLSKTPDAAISRSAFSRPKQA